MSSLSIREAAAPVALPATVPASRLHGVAASLKRWFDTEAEVGLDERADRIDWLRAIPFIGIHLACIGVYFVGISRCAVTTAIALYAIRMFALTGFYHRYFAHKAFRTSRAVQFAFALIGAVCVQRGPLWWAAHHRNHHRFADTERDQHSPRPKLWQQRWRMFWMACAELFGYDHGNEWMVGHYRFVKR